MHGQEPQPQRQLGCLEEGATDHALSLRERQDGPDEDPLGLNISRFDERQRRQRLVLPQAASCWDYAPLLIA